MVAPKILAPKEATRRDFLGLSLSAGFFSACSRPLAPRFPGWLFIASAQEKGISIADLSQFRHVNTIPLGETPGQLLRAGEKVFVTCPTARQLVEIDPARFAATTRLPMPGRIVGAQPASDGTLVVVATAQPAALIAVDARTGRIVKRVNLPSDPEALDVSDLQAAVTGAGALTRIGLRNWAILGTTPLGETTGSMRFRKDGKAILTGLARSRQILTLDAESGTVLARLPLRFAPGRFCFNPDGGQMFVTADGEDAVAIVSPYQSQVDQTIVAGRTPFGMAVSPSRNLILITNPASGDLTILDIETRRLSASVHIGGAPGEVLLTPDEEYALVMSREAGDVAVVRMKTVLDRTVKTKPMLTMFPMGGLPQSSLILKKPA